MAFTFPWLKKTVVMSSPDQPAEDELEVVAGAANPDTYVPLALAMQYSGSTGNPKLMSFIREHVERSFHIPYSCVPSCSSPAGPKARARSPD